MSLACGWLVFVEEIGEAFAHFGVLQREVKRVHRKPAIVGFGVVFEGAMLRHVGGDDDLFHAKNVVMTRNH